jgi:hypothetical protein
MVTDQRIRATVLQYLHRFEYYPAKGGRQRENLEMISMQCKLTLPVDVVAQFRYEGPFGNNSCFPAREGQGMLEYVTAHSP